MIEPKTKINIDGEYLSNFEHLNLTQTMNDHHHFDVVVDLDIIEKEGAHTIENSKEWLGKPIVIAFDEKEFLGTIVDVQMVHSQGYNGKLIISGYSKTILLESGAHMQSWLDKDMGKIVKDVTDAGGIEAEIAPVHKTPFEYQAQYAETHFQFLQRLAKQHNEWLYYDGLKLIFGKPALENAIELEYGKDIDHINISIKAIPGKHNTFSYNALDDKQEESKTKDDVAGLNELGDFSFKVSKDLYKITPNGFSSARVSDKNQIDTIIKNKQSSAVAKSNMMTGSSTKQGLTVGSVIKVSAGTFKNGKLETKNYGEYIITGITHHATGTYEYFNQFEAISAGVEFLPEPLVEMPVAQPQIATVLSNEDPKKKGRVEVQFQWQTGEMKTAWIRVMAPDAGKSDNVGTNRGFVFIPEEGDQVMVGFRYNDPNRPFVMGSLFSGTTGAGGGDANKTKSLTTRSGCTITIDDDEGAGKITISDPSGNTITLNGDETITISAPTSITMNSKEISLNAEDKITLTGDNNVEINSKEILAQATTALDLKSDANMSVSSMAKEEAHTTYNLEADATVDINGTAITNVKGGMVNLN